MKPRHTFRGVVMKTDPAARLKSLAPNGPVPAGGPGTARVRWAGRPPVAAARVSRWSPACRCPPRHLEALGTRLKKLCGAGGAVRDGIIEIQGDHRDRLVQELVKLGYEAKRSGG